MRIAPALIFALLLGLVTAQAQTAPKGNLDAHITGDIEFSPDTGIFQVSNDVVVVITFTSDTGVSTNAVISADRMSVNTNSGDIFAEGSVRVQQEKETLVGPAIHMNFKTGEVELQDFRLGEPPYFAGGGRLVADVTNGAYVVSNAFVTTDDYSDPLQRVSAGKVTVVPGQYVKARNAVLHLAGVPVFYFPYFKRSLQTSPNHFTFVPGYRGTFGPYLLSGYNWVLNSNLNGAVHADWRARRGFGAGPDLNFNFGDLGEGIARYYFTHDDRPGIDPVLGTAIRQTRQRAYLGFSASPVTNVTLMGQVAYQSDPYIVRDFFESQYQRDFQPNTFFDVDKQWQNWSLDVLAQPRVNPFFESVERLPDARLTGFRQQVFETPIYYESESSAGYYRRLFANTNLLGADYYGERADTFQQLTLPETFFGWLNVTPRAGGRFTYYSPTTGPGAATTNQQRWVFNTGAKVSFKASQTWPGFKSSLLDADGLRHIIEPSVNYVYIPRPNVGTNLLPQYDYEVPNNLQLLPLEFPDYNSIDSIDSQNTLRFGLNNILETKRNGTIDTLVNWNVLTDWHLRTRTNQTSFSDVYSELAVKPRKWLKLESLTKFDVTKDRFNLAVHSATFEPNNTWSWTVGHYFLRDDPAFGIGNNLLTSTFFYRLNENWGTRVAHYFDARTGTLQEQDYTIYRDLRSWTAALTFRSLDSQATGHDFSVAATFSFKAFPRFHPGQDTASAASLLGY